MSMNVLKDSLYHQYITERNGFELIENEAGFLVYKINGIECFIVDMFVAKDKRNKYYGTDLINELVKIALENKCINITANIHLWDKNCNSTLVASILTGFVLVKADSNILLIEKLLGV